MSGWLKVLLGLTMPFDEIWNVHVVKGEGFRFEWNEVAPGVRFSVWGVGSIIFVETGFGI